MAKTKEYSSRRLLFLRALIVISLILGYSVTGMAEKAVITHWMHHSPARVEMFQTFAAEFMEANPDVEIRVESFPLSEYMDKLLVALIAESGPDTIQINARRVQEFVRSGIIQPLSETLISAQQMEKDFVSAAIAPLKANNKYYGLPTDAQSIVLFYQPAIFEAAGIRSEEAPKTWEELVATARKIHRRNSDNLTELMGVATGGYGPVLFTLMRQSGASLWDEKAALPKVDSPEAVAGLKFATDLVAEYGVEDRKFGSRWTAFRNEKLGMVYAHPAMKGSFLSSHPDLEFNIGQVPAPQAGGSQASMLTSWALSVTNNADVELATKWLMYVESADAQKRWLVETGELPTLWSVIRHPQFQSDPNLRNVLWSMPTAFAEPWTADAHMNLANEAWRTVTDMKASPAMALTTMQDKAVIAEQEAQRLMHQ